MRRRKLPKKEVARRIVKAIGEGIFTGGLENSTEANRLAEAMFSAKRPQFTAEAAFSPILAHLFYAAIGPIAESAKKRGFTEEELQPILDKIRSTGERLPADIRKGINEMKKKLIRRGGPGRAEALIHSDKIEAVEQISTMVKTKVMKLPDVFEAVAETFTARGKKVSARTIKRVWEGRQRLYERS